LFDTPTQTISFLLELFQANSISANRLLFYSPISSEEGHIFWRGEEEKLTNVSVTFKQIARLVDLVVDISAQGMTSGQSALEMMWSHNVPVLGLISSEDIKSINRIIPSLISALINISSSIPVHSHKTPLQAFGEKLLCRTVWELKSKAVSFATHNRWELALIRKALRMNQSERIPYFTKWIKHYEVGLRQALNNVRSNNFQHVFVDSLN